MGLAYLAPIGAQNLFVINTALTAPLGIALVTAGIVAFFDISLALACFWGIGLMIEHSLLLQKALLGGGGLILIYLAWQLLHAQVQTDTYLCLQPADAVANGHAGLYRYLVQPAGRYRRYADAGRLSLITACRYCLTLYQRRSSCLLPVVLRAYRHLQNLLPKSAPQPYAMDQPHLRRRYFCLRPQTALYLWADAVKTMNTHIKKQQLFKLLLLFCSDPFNLLL